MLIYSARATDRNTIIVIILKRALSIHWTRAGPPVDWTRVGLPVDWTTAGIPVDCTTSGIPVDWTTAGIPVDWTTAGIPVDWTTAGIPIGIGGFGSPVGAFRLQELWSHDRLLGMHLVHQEGIVYLAAASDSNLSEIHGRVVIIAGGPVCIYICVCKCVCTGSEETY